MNNYWPEETGTISIPHEAGREVVAVQRDPDQAQSSRGWGLNRYRNGPDSIPRVLYTSHGNGLKQSQVDLSLFFYHFYYFFPTEATLQRQHMQQKSW